MRASGDMNTALGNCLLMCALMYGLAKQLGVMVEIADDGDDCCIICSSSDKDLILERLPSFFLEAGFTAKVEMVTNVFEEIEFCQCHPVFNGETWVMTRSPIKALSSDLKGVGKWRDVRSLPHLLGVVGTGGAHLTKGIPVLSKFYDTFPLGTKRPRKARLALESFKETGFGRMTSGMVDGAMWCKRPAYTDPTDEARISFYKAFKVSPSDQVLLEAHLGSHPPFPVGHRGVEPLRLSGQPSHLRPMRDSVVASLLSHTS